MTKVDNDTTTTAQAKADTRTCTCHPDDHPPVPCPRKFAYSECVATALAGKIEAEFYRAGERGLIPPFVFSTSELHVILRALRNEPGARPCSPVQDVAPDIIDALRSAEEGLRTCYQVCDYPANGRSQQDYSLAQVSSVLQRITSGQPQAGGG
jgi:hypothetical protein